MGIQRMCRIFSHYLVKYLVCIVKIAIYLTIRIQI